MAKLTEEQYNDITVEISNILTETSFIRYGQAFAIVLADKYPQVDAYYTELYSKNLDLDMWEQKDPAVVHEFINKYLLA